VCIIHKILRYICIILYIRYLHYEFYKKSHLRCDSLFSSKPHYFIEILYFENKLGAFAITMIAEYVIFVHPPFHKNPDDKVEAKKGVLQRVQ